MLRLAALAVGVRIGKNEDALVVADDAAFAARVARQARVMLGIEIARDHAVANLEAGFVALVEAQLDRGTVERLDSAAPPSSNPVALAGAGAAACPLAISSRVATPFSTSSDSSA